jgi:hypothetical protein
MKDGIKEIIGKTIAGVVIAHNNHRPPREQIFLVFDDESSYEIYGESFTCASGIYPRGMEGVLRYAKLAPGAVVTRVYLSNGLLNKNHPAFWLPDTGEYLH